MYFHIFYRKNKKIDMDISEASPEKKQRLDFEDFEGLHTSEPVEISEGENEKSNYFLRHIKTKFSKKEMEK